jgi:hypothetical protein
VPSFHENDGLVSVIKPWHRAEGAVSFGIATRAFNRTILELIGDAGQSLCVREIPDILAEPWQAVLQAGVRLVIARVRTQCLD